MEQDLTHGFFSRNPEVEIIQAGNVVETEQKSASVKRQENVATANKAETEITFEAGENIACLNSGTQNTEKRRTEIQDMEPDLEFNPDNRFLNNANSGEGNPDNGNSNNNDLNPAEKTEKRKKKKPEEMTDHELLAALLKSQKSDTRFQKAAAVGTFLLAAVFAIAFAILIPQVTLTLRNADNALDQVQVLAGQAQNSLDNVNGLVDSAQHSLSGIDKVVEDNTETITEVTQKLGQIDFDKLDQSIDDLAEVVKTLSEVTSLFR